MLLGWFEPIVEALISRYARPGGVIIDAGAQLGYFTLRFARAVGPEGAVHAFECDPRVITRLRQHVQINGCDQKGTWDGPHDDQVTSISVDDYVDEHGIDPARVQFIKL
jgi:tRNA A58 N-methylase Trm61